MQDLVPLEGKMVRTNDAIPLGRSHASISSAGFVCIAETTMPKTKPLAVGHGTISLNWLEQM
jgi:hypothetical protein